MVPLNLKELSFVVASGLASKYPHEQFLPTELADVMLGLINSVGLAALNVAIDSAQRIENESEWESLKPTTEILTIDRFATSQVSRDYIVSIVSDMSGFDREVASTALGLIEVSVDKGVFASEPSEVEFEGLGVISAGPANRSYHISLIESLHVPPLRHVSLLGELLHVTNSTAA